MPLIDIRENERVDGANLVVFQLFLRRCLLEPRREHLSTCWTRNYLVPYFIPVSSCTECQNTAVIVILSLVVACAAKRAAHGLFAVIVIVACAAEHVARGLL